MAESEWATLDDDALALRARNDRKALEALLERSAPMAARVAYSITGQHADALDAAQDALVRIANDVHTLWSGKSYRAWAFAYARSAAIDLRRKNAGAARIARSAQAASSKEQEMPESSADRDEVLAALREELTELPVETAAALSLFHLDGLSVSDVAAQVGISVDACKQRLSRGRETLRERLERRGLASGTALAAMAGIENVYASAKTWAAKVDPTEFSRVAQNAFALHGAQDSESPASNRPSAATASHNRFVEREPMKRTRNMEKLYLLAVLGILLLGGAGLVAFKSHEAHELENARTVLHEDLKPRRTETPAMQQSANATQPLQPESKPVAEIQSKAQERAAPQWQEPRFIDGNFHPLSISVFGSKVALLTSDSDQLQPAKRLVLFESNDAGQTWSQTATLDGYLSGYGDFDQTSGDYAFLGMTVLSDAPTDELKAIRVKELTALSHGTSSELRVRKAGKTEFGSPVEVWASEGEELLQIEPRFFSAGGSTWAFQPRVVERKGKLELPKHTIRMRAAHAPRDGKLKAVSGEWKIPGSSAPVAWAKDDQTAGFVTNGDHGELCQYTTSDGGQTWKSSVIPFQLPSDSGVTLRCANPSAITRDGDTLLLLVFTLSHPNNPPVDEPDGMLFQRYTLLSTDLGKTWATPYAASPRDERMAEGDGVHILTGQLVMCETSAPGLREEIKRIGEADFVSNRHRIDVRLSDDGGKSWSNHQAFAQLSKQAEQIVMGGDRESLHVAIFRGTELGSKEKGCLIIRSFVNGTWTAPTQPAPSWFKAEKVPDAHKEDF